jgi:hypothetical protein
VAYTISQIRVADPLGWKHLWEATETIRRAAGARATLRQPDPTNPGLFVVVVDASEHATAEAYGPFGSHSPARLLEALHGEGGPGQEPALVSAGL